MSNLFIRIVNGLSGLSSDASTEFSSKALSSTPLLVGTAAVLNLYGYSIYNPNASSIYIKFYNSAVLPVVGTTATYFKLQVASGGSIVLYGSDILKSFSAGLYVAATTGYLDSDTGAPVTNLEISLNYKQ